MKGVSDFPERAECSFDITTGRSKVAQIIPSSEPIYEYARNQLGLTAHMVAWLDTQGWKIYALPSKSGSIREFELRNYRKVTGGFISARWHRVNDVPTYVGDGADTLVSDMTRFDPECRKTHHRASCTGHECEEPHLHYDDHDTNEHFAKTTIPVLRIDGKAEFVTVPSDGASVENFVTQAKVDHMKKYENKPNYTVSQDELRGYNSAERKDVPIHAFMTGYFPDALWALARLSKKANDKHNPGEPMHWARGKSTDQLECAQRHLFTPFEIDPETAQPELAAVAWRALAELQLYEEKRLLREGIKPLSGVTK